MATPQAVLAVLRSSGQTFRHDSDKLAFAVHAAILTSGYRLIGVGDDVSVEGVPQDPADVPAAGWDAAAPERYTFLYAPEEPPAAAPVPPQALLARLLSLGPSSLLLSLASGSKAAAPVTLELQVERFVLPQDAGGNVASNIGKSLQHVDELISRVETAVSEATPSVPSSSGTKAAVGSGAASGGEAAVGSQRPEQGLREPLRVGPPMRAGRHPDSFGDDDTPDDLLPLGRDPLLLGGHGVGGPSFGPSGSGMHVGPGHPYFAERMRHPDLVPGRGGLGGGPGLPPGARWDPINPEGLQGWHPDDFQHPGRGGPLQPGGRAGRQVHPDIMQPGPGPRADFDHMFG